MGNPIFLIDANVFVEASRRYYAFDLAPKFWDSLIESSRAGRIESIDRIKQELERGKDDLAKWAKSHFHSAFVSTNDADVVDAYREIMAWVGAHKQFSDLAKADFAKGADGWLVAYAKAKGRIVVTQEVLNLEIKRRVPIPNVCEIRRTLPRYL
jgi:hypothetical protein